MEGGSHVELKDDDAYKSHFRQIVMRRWACLGSPNWAHGAVGPADVELVEVDREWLQTSSFHLMMLLHNAKQDEE